MEIDQVLNTSTRHAEGFRGYLSLLSHDNPNAVTVLTPWHDEETLKKTETGTIKDAIQKVRDSFEGPSHIENFT